MPRNIKKLLGLKTSLMLLVFLQFGFLIFFNSPKVSAALTLCLNGQSAEEGQCQSEYGVDEAPGPVRQTCGILISPSARADCIVRECPRYGCTPQTPNAPGDDYDGNVLCSNGQYGSATYDNDGNCDDQGSGVTVVSRDIAAQCGTLSDVGNRALCIAGAEQATSQGSDTCGEGEEEVNISFNIGCKGQGNPILDMLFAITRFLSYGVGLVLIGAMIITGIQYTASRGNPEATKIMVERLLNLAGAILIYVFAFAILNYLVPGQVLK